MATTPSRADALDVTCPRDCTPWADDRPAVGDCRRSPRSSDTATRRRPGQRRGWRTLLRSPDTTGDGHRAQPSLESSTPVDEYDRSDGDTRGRRLRSLFLPRGVARQLAASSRGSRAKASNDEGAPSWCTATPTPDRHQWRHSHAECIRAPLSNLGHGNDSRSGTGDDCR